MPVSQNNPVKQRAVIVSGARTPFLRAFGAYTKMDSIALGVAAVRGLLDKTKLPTSEIDAIVWGGVILPGGAPNVGREIALDLGLPHSVEASTVTRACTSGMLAITQAIAAVERGEADVIIAGGSDSTSNAEVKMPQSFVHKTAPVLMSAKSGVLDYFKLLFQLSLRKDLLPQRPQIKERTTKELMGEAAERMAKLYGISREEQDAFAAQSHHRAAAAIASGRFKDEIVPVTTPSGKVITEDNLVRGDTSVEKLAKLKPVFAKGGSLTAGNSSALTDGAACVLIMSEEKARALGLTPLASFKSWSYDAVDPAGQLLIGPAISIPRALERAGMALGDVDIVDIHEAFAAQVLCVLKAMGSDAFAKEWIGIEHAPGALAPEAINIHGGSVALGHPFGATGARIILTLANELHQGDKQTAVFAICAAGGQSGAGVMESVR